MKPLMCNRGQAEQHETVVRSFYHSILKIVSVHYTYTKHVNKCGRLIKWHDVSVLISIVSCLCFHFREYCFQVIFVYSRTDTAQLRSTVTQFTYFKKTNTAYLITDKYMCRYSNLNSATNATFQVLHYQFAVYQHQYQLYRKTCYLTLS